MAHRGKPRKPSPASHLKFVSQLKVLTTSSPKPIIVSGRRASYTKLFINPTELCFLRDSFPLAQNSQLNRRPQITAVTRFIRLTPLEYPGYTFRLLSVEFKL